MILCVCVIGHTNSPTDLSDRTLEGVRIDLLQSISNIV